MNKGFSIVSSGVYLPNTVNSTELDKLYGYKDGSHQKITGVKQRYYVSEDEQPCDMAKIAIENALRKVSLAIDDIDCLISASATTEQIIPYNASKILSKFDVKRHIHSFDVNMTCLSFVQALSIAGLYLRSGIYKRILISSSEIASLSLNRKDLKLSGLFGDGAAAFILESSDSKNLNNNAKFETFPDGHELCKVESGGYLHHPMKKNSQYKEKSFFEMDGKKLFKLAGKHLPYFIEEYLKNENLTMKNIDMVIPHQASHLGMSHIQKKLNIPENKFYNIFENYGNQIAASIPIALDHAINNNNIKRGDQILLLGTSAGVSIGSFVLEY